MLINTFLDTEDFVHLYYPEDEPAGAQGCGAGARMASKYPRPPSPEYSSSQSQVSSSSSRAMSERDRERDRERWGAPPQPEPPPHRVRAADLYPRLRTHCDEPGLDVPFTPICGEFVQWVGRTADGGTIAMSNYRLHAQPRRRSGPGASVPLRLIDAVEIKDLLCLIVQCKHGRQLQCTFTTGDKCLEWWQRLSTALAPMSSVQETFAAAYAAWAKEQPPASVHRALMRASNAPHRNWFGPEVERLGFTTKAAWRVTAANADYKLCSSYPPLLVVPASIGDEDLDSVARFRAMRRVPAVVWRHKGNGAVIARTSQPEVGWFGWRSSEDERLLAAFVTACNTDRGVQPANTNKQTKLLIVDARSYASAVTNRARGGGCECQQYYPFADIQFMSLPNIHHVRRSFLQLRALAAEPSDQANWHSNLERTLWLQYISGVARAASVVARAVLAGRPVLVHCSDGWDRTPQIVAAAQLILDVHYRTLEGFRVLVEREWLDFGHKFADRCGHQFGPEDPNERSPIFLQWLDVVYQLMRQYPCSFEFNEAYLIKLATHVHSCMFGTFLCNTSRERSEARVPETTAQVWELLRAPAYRNHLYSPHHSRSEQVLWPEYGVRSMQLWWGMYCGEREEPDDDQPEPEAVLPPHPPANGLMTKTRSCDNLLSEGEKRTTQRRCSDPSIAPDVMKLSSIMAAECDPRRETRALTDSCVDELRPVLDLEPERPDQVDGLHPDHFETPRLPRDLASGSSSLERELGGAVDSDHEPADIDRVIDHDEPVRPAIEVEVSPEGTPEDTAVFVRAFDERGLSEGPQNGSRTRHISITWRSISESSNQSSTGFDLPEPHERSPVTHELSPVTHELSPVTRDLVTSDGDHERSPTEELMNHLPQNGVSNGINGVDEIEPKFLEIDLNGSGSGRGPGPGSTSSSSGSPPRRARGSQLTLCPASPRRRCPHCSTSGIETSGESGTSSECWCGVCGGELGASRVRCVCGALAAHAADPLDGLPPVSDPLQARLHQIILYQKKVVEELTGQLRSARQALRRASPPPAAPARPSPSAPSPTQMTSSGSGRGSASGSSSGSASEVEVGEEARGVVWLPDSAAPRCQHCRNHFWLARRRHHCRRCGGIFCGSCSEMSPWGGCAVRVCRRCRALR
ncbi:myotubularin-related protein 4 isoform X3 [Leguminivora glycinivorella]|uniref:myotubularin-related protein 4 isoform X3 n=1 Tax=Leguminivora glycinivorella TaxID=1035111 RepID=UPI00200E4281|nr:myotubularin-related protein 4 isoform X3 [Leguminivora glycinivorella]